MDLSYLDSRTSLGSDIERKRLWASPCLQESSAFDEPWIEMRQVRVILSDWGAGVRLSAPDLDIVIEGPTFADAWAGFLCEVRNRPDSAWLTFDVARTRLDEISEGLDVPEDEDWSTCGDAFED